MKNSAYEFKALEARTGWLSPALRWSVRVALGRPVWVPGVVARVPLTAVLAVMQVQVKVWGWRHGW